MSKKGGYYTGDDYWGYNPETGKYDKRCDTEAEYLEWYEENFEEDED